MLTEFLLGTLRRAIFALVWTVGVLSTGLLLQIREWGSPNQATIIIPTVGMVAFAWSAYIHPIAAAFLCWISLFGMGVMLGELPGLAVVTLSPLFGQP
jgi:hypothetical protein